MIKGDLMHNIETYYKTKHDIANQLQLLEAYFSLGQVDKARHFARRITMQFRDEQQFLKLNCPNAIHYYIDTVLENKLFDWTFEIELLTSAIGLNDSVLTSFIDVCVKDFEKRVATKSLLTLSLFENEQTIECMLALTGEIIDTQYLLPNMIIATTEIIEYKLEIIK
ncbi:Spo0B domain-containing protein [Macrococcus sp. TMW 2.2395]|nr:Spo0B domain-containing protein [Macrococcus sp. TMW 2.2395]